MTRTKTLAAVSAAALALTLSACSDDSDSPTDPTSSTSGTSSGSDGAPATPKDRSDEVFGAYEGPPEVLGSTTGAVTMGIGGGQTGKVTFEVTGVTATVDSTILHYHLVSDSTTKFGMRGEFWPQQPALRVPGTDVRTQPITATLPGGQGPAQEACVCTAVRDAFPEAQPQEVVYPPLSEDVDEIDVIFNDLDPVTVPVTR